MKIKYAFGEYIGDGTAQAGDEDCFSAELETGDGVAIVKREHFVAMAQALKHLSKYNLSSLWADDRDAAAGCMLNIAKKALDGRFEREDDDEE